MSNKTWPALRREAFSISEAATMLGIARCTLYRLAQCGELPTARIGKKLLIRRTTLERLLDDGSGVKET